LGNWISVYSEDPQQLAAVGSKSEAVEKQVLEKNPALSEPREQRCLARLIEGDFVGGEQPDGHLFVRAFRAVCIAYSAHTATVEIYVDEDQFPEIWAFVWDAAEVPCGLPVSEFGSPAIAYWDRESVQRHIANFSKLDYAAIAKRNSGTSYQQEISELLAVLCAAGRGVYVFFEE
jgi:hypothetical protein